MSSRPSTTLDRPRRGRSGGKAVDRSGTFSLKQLSEMTPQQLGKIAKTLQVEEPASESGRPQELIFQILKAQAEHRARNG